MQLDPAPGGAAALRQPPLPNPGDAFDAAAALRGCAGGDRAALRALYDAFAPRMLGVAMRLLRRRDLAEEVVHDAFMRIWEKAASYDPARGEPATWIFTILRRLALNVLRGEARTDLVEDDDRLDVASDEADAEAVVSALSTRNSPAPLPGAAGAAAPPRHRSGLHARADPRRAGRAPRRAARHREVLDPPQPRGPAGVHGVTRPARTTSTASPPNTRSASRRARTSPAASASPPRTPASPPPSRPGANASPGWTAPPPRSPRPRPCGAASRPGSRRPPPPPRPAPRRRALRRRGPRRRGLRRRRRGAAAGPWWRALWGDLRVWRGVGLAGAAAALVLAVALGSALRESRRAPVLVAILLGEADRPAAVVNAFADGRTELVPLDAITAPPGRSLQVWTLWDRARGPVSVGLLDALRSVDLAVEGPAGPGARPALRGHPGAGRRLSHGPAHRPRADEGPRRPGALSPRRRAAGRRPGRRRTTVRRPGCPSGERGRPRRGPHGKAERWKAETMTDLQAPARGRGERPIRRRVLDLGDGGRAHVLEQGRGPPVLLLHGMGGLGAEILAPLGLLADRYRLIAVDRPGYGDSFGRPEDAMSPPAQAAWLLDVLDRLGVPRALLVAHSLASAHALWMATSRPGASLGW